MEGLTDMARAKLCAGCRHPWMREGLVPRDALCDKCGKHLHSCKNCAFYDPLVSTHCRRKNGDPGETAESKNFCDIFVFRESLELSFKRNKLDRQSAEQQWKSLFKDN